MPTLNIPRNSDQHKTLVSRIQSRIKAAIQAQSLRHPKWKEAENQILAYIPENQADAIRRNRRDNNGEPVYTTLQVPYSYALLMTAHTYWTSVFFARNPVHQFAGRHGQGEMQVQALEALIQYQVDVGQMLAPYYLWLYDAGKYGQGILGNYWDRKLQQFGNLIVDPSSGKMTHVSQQTVGYQGNCVYNVSPYNFFPDPRVSFLNFQKGEFCAVWCDVSWSQVQLRQLAKDYMNVEHIQGEQKSKPLANDEVSASSNLERPRFNWNIEDGTNIKHPARIGVYEFYVECSPKEWGLGAAETTEKWVFTISDDFETILSARPHGAVHCAFPFDVIEPEMEAYGTHGRGLPEMVRPLQNTMDWLLNTHLYNVRASLNNQFIADPSRINMKDVQKGGPGFVFRVRPNAYGQDVRTMIHQMPVNDVTQTHMTDVNSMFSIGERVFGINEQMFGMLASGGRKSATEVRTATGFGVSRQKTQTEWISASAFQLHSTRLVQNSQQYYDGETKLRIVGDLAQTAGMGFINVTPEQIAGQWDTLAVDGTMPVDRFAQLTVWKDMLGQLMATPIGASLFQQFDISKLFGWLMGLGGIKNVNQFKVQVMQPGQQPMPGSVPISGGGANVVQFPGSNSTTQAGGAAVAPQTY